MSNSRILSKIPSGLSSNTGKLLSIENGEIVWQQNYAWDSANNANTEISSLKSTGNTQNTRLLNIENVNSTQNTNITNLTSWLNSNNTLQASINTTQNTNIIAIQGIDNAQNTRLTVIEGTDVTQNTNISNLTSWLSSNNTLQANINTTQNTNIALIQGVDNTQNTSISSAFVQANSAYTKANSAITLGSTPLYLGSTNTSISGLTLTSSAFNGTVGVTTPSSGNFTTLDATGNVTLGDASGDTLTINGTAVSIPNNLNFDSNTLFIDAANNQVGIGTSSPGVRLDVVSISSSAVGARIRARSGADDYGFLQFTNNAGTTEYAAVSGSSGTLAFYTGTASTERMNINSAGTLILNQGQIKFPATQVASADANTLDDYEEGTFTITFYGSSSGSGNVSGNAVYTKIGRMVTITLNISNQTLPTYSGDLLFSLPFTCYGASVTEYRGGEAYFYPSAAWDAVTNFVGIVPGCIGGESVGRFGLIQLDSDRQTSLGSTNSNTSGATNVYLRFSLTYFTNT